MSSADVWRYSPENDEYVLVQVHADVYDLVGYCRYDLKPNDAIIATDKHKTM